MTRKRRAHQVRNFKGRALDFAVTTAILLGVNWIFERLAGEEQLEKALAFQAQLYAAVNQPDAFTVAKHFGHHISADKIQIIDGRATEISQQGLIQALFETIGDEVPPTAIT